MLGKPYCFKPSVQSSFRIHQPKIFKNINFLMPISDFSFRDSFNPPPSFQYIFFQTLVYCLLQKYLWEHVPTFFTFFCCHVVQNIRVLLGAHVPAYERPESLAQKS